jgi:Septum formation
MRPHVRALALASVAVGLLSGMTPLLGVADAAESPTTTPSRFVRQVCAALNTWDDKANTDNTSPEKVLTANKKSMKSTRQAVVTVLASDLKATDTLIAATKALGTPRVPDGQRVATDYLQTLGDARDALSAAHSAAARMPIANRAVLTAALTTMDNNLVGQFQAIGNPLSVLNTDQTLAAAIQADPGCATVLQFYKSATTSGLEVGDCITSSETKVDCTKPHDGEVTLVTSYVADSTAPYPGNDALNAFVDQTCNAAFTSYVGVPFDESMHTYGYYYPNPGADWDGGDREIVCTVTNEDNTPLTGSLKGQTS